MATPTVRVKAGRCFASPDNPKRITPSEVPGEIHVGVSPEDELVHFRWTPRRDGTIQEEDFDLIVFPGDASFVPYTYPGSAPKDGRIYVLKFLSSSERHFFWWQTKVSEGDAAGEHSRRDRLVARKIDRLIQTGGELDEGMTDEDLLADDDTKMELDDDTAPSAGESSRRGGEDGGRASDDPFEPPATIPTSTGASSSTPANQTDFLASLLRGISVPGGGAGGASSQGFLTLPSLLPTSVTTQILSYAPLRKNLLANLPPAITAGLKSEYEETELLRKVLHSPQFSQAAAGMTVALREGGLRGVADSLGVPLDLSSAGAQGGVEIFVDGVRKEVEKETEGEDVEMGN